jgi:hypothetical protein
MKRSRIENDLEPEYDFRGGVRGKHAERYAQGSNIILLAPDVARCFPDSDSVNEALRVLINAAARVKPTKPSRKKSGS